MSSRVTQCPNCQTSFRVTDAQLNIANGAVRCGSCLHIFNAHEHWLGQTTPPAASPSSPESKHSAPHPATAPPIDEDDDKQLFCDENGLAGEDDEDFGSEPQPSQPALPEQSSAPVESSFTTEGDSEATEDYSEVLASELDLDEDEPLDIEDIRIDLSANTEELSDIEDELELDSDETFSEEALSSDSFDEDSQFLSLDNIFKDPDDEPAKAEPSPAEDDSPNDATLIGDAGLDDSGGASDLSDQDADDQRLFGNEKLDDTGSQSLLDQGMMSDEDFHNTDGEQGTGLSDSFLDMEQWEDSPSAVFKELDESQDSCSEEDDWTKKLLEDDEDISTEAEQDSLTEQADDAFEEYPEQLDDEPEPEQQLDPDLLDILNETPAQQDYPEPEEDEFILGDEPLLAGERIGESQSQLLANLETEPLQMSFKSQGGRWRNLGWAAAIVLSLIALFGQYINANFDRLARDPQLRPVFAQLCPTLNCQLPSIDDIKHIRSTNLMVRSHPRQANALVVDAMITNHAGFQQAFPLMELQFTDIAGNIIAGRSFKPSEYLAGEMAGATTMPSRQPIHIALEIADPGKQAVNYQLVFHRNKRG